MEIFGVSVPVLNILMAMFAILLTSIMYDWLSLLAFKRKYKLKGPTPLPLVGNMLAIFTMAAYESEEKNRKIYGPVYMTSAGCLRVINVSDINLLKKIFIKDHIKFQNRFSMEGIEPPPLDKGLLTLKDAHWKRVRNIITPTFSIAKLKLMVGEMNHAARLLVKGLTDKAKAGETVDVHKHFGCFTMDTIASTAFGIRTDSYNNPDQPFVEYAKKVFGQGVLTNPLILLAFMFPNLTYYLSKYCGLSVFYPLDSLAVFTSLIKEQIQKRKESPQEGRVDLLQMLVNAEMEGSDEKACDEKKLRQDEILAQGFLVFIAGYDTLHTLLSFFAYAMAMNPDIQLKLIEEVDALVPQEEDLKYDVVMEMPYLDQVICETLRMYPPLLRMNRTTSAGQDVEIDGYCFPGNTAIQYSIWQMHHQMGFYPEPQVFRPERFSPEEKKNRDPFVFIPFGNGPRNCIGMRMALLEAKMAVVHVLRSMKFVKCPETEENLELVHETFLRPKRPIKLGVELRDRASD